MKPTDQASSPWIVILVLTLMLLGAISIWAHRRNGGNMARGGLGRVVSATADDGH